MPYLDRFEDLLMSGKHSASPPQREHSLHVLEKPVRYRKCGHVAYVTLNRPRVLNAMNEAMHERLKGVWDDFECDRSLWVAVLTGMGDRAFSVGQDLKELVNRNQAGMEPTSFGSFGRAGWPRLTERFNLSKPVIGRLNGDAIGGGLELALACDILVAADHISLGLPEARLGLVAGAGGLFRLARQVPLKAAMGYLMTGRSFSAKRAYELGLVNEVVSRTQLDACIARWVRDILQCAPLAVRAVKGVWLASAHLALDDAFRRTYEGEELRRKSRDCREGPLAFVQKRDPRWLAR